MRRSLPTFVIALAAGVAMTGAAALFDLTPPVPPAPAAAADDAADDTAPPAPLAPAPTKPPQPSALTRVPSPEPPRAALQPPPAALQPPPAAPQPPPVHDPAYEAVLAERFDADEPSSNTDFAIAIDQKIRAGLPPGSVGEPLHCGKDLCRMRSVHNSMDAYQEYLSATFFNEDPEARAWSGPTFLTQPNNPSGHDNGAGVVSVIYFARSGALPSP